MGRKKQIEGSVMSIELPADPVVEPKKKREMSDKQKENLAKGMAILKAKREAKAKKEEQEIVEAPPAVAPSATVAPEAPVRETPPNPPVEKQKKERKPRVVKNYLTTEDFNLFKNEILSSMKKVEPIIPPPVVVTPSQPPQVVKEVIKERVITGRELLDKVFGFK